MLALDRFEWQFPSEFQLASQRQEFRNVYGYTTDFVKKENLFGENKFFPQPDVDIDEPNELNVRKGGQLNITTAAKNKKKDYDIEVD